MLAGSRYGGVLRRALNQGLEATTSPHRSPRGFPTPQWHGVLTSPDDGPHGFPVRCQSCITRYVCNMGNETAQDGGLENVD
jgi:hypothetical protein